MTLDSFLELLSDNSTSLGVFILIAVGSFGVWRRSSAHRKAELSLKKAKQSKLDEPISLHPQIDTTLCTGCAVCTKVCPEGDILQLINHQAVLVSPTKCVGHGECEMSCPKGAIKLVFGTKTRGMDMPRMTQHYETNVPGLYIAGELGGMGLIRNAVKQGHLAAQHALSQVSKNSNEGVLDLLIVGGGPAGLSAALTAVAEKKTYLCIEQNSFGGTVFNYPRQKIVMSAPIELPVVGARKFRSNKVSKEELLDLWTEIRAGMKLKIQEKTKFESLEKKADYFEVKSSRGMLKAKKVILAMGVRGTPRKLGLPGEDLPKVTYNLVDPEQYRDCNLVVVGGGNAGVEAAQSLADENLNNKVILLVRGPQFDRCNDDNQKRIFALAEKKRVSIYFNAQVKEIFPSSLVIEKEGKPHKVANDYLFVFAGAEMPQKMLMSFGVELVKKFGEGLNDKPSSSQAKTSN